MQNLDFTKMMKKYPLLTAKDVSFLNKFFNREDIQLILAEIDSYRKKNRKWKRIIQIFTLIIFIVSSISIYLYSSKNSEMIMISAVFAFFISLIFMGLGFWILSMFSKETKSIKSNVVPEFVKSMNSNIKYSKGGAYFKDSFSDLKKKGFLEKYTRVDLVEDSIKYILGENNKSIEITGCEFKASEKRTRRTKNGTQTYYVVTNHCYLMKVNFKNPRYVIKKSIKLLEDISDNYKKRTLKVLGIQAAIIFGFLNAISGDENSDGYLVEFWELVKNNLEISITFLIGMFFVIWFIFSYFREKKRIKLENIDFEKEFDVFGDDGIESRKLLTPSFMYRLVDFVNKINHKRVYEMFFHDNYFYLKYNFLKTNHYSNGFSFRQNNYMEFSDNKDVFKNLNPYVEFYLELKNITNLSKDLKLFYYDKGTMSKRIIKGGKIEQGKFPKILPM